MESVGSYVNPMATTIVPVVTDRKDQNPVYITKLATVVDYSICKLLFYTLRSMRNTK